MLIVELSSLDFRVNRLLRWKKATQISQDTSCPFVNSDWTAFKGCIDIHLKIIISTMNIRDWYANFPTLIFKHLNSKREAEHLKFVLLLPICIKWVSTSENMPFVTCRLWSTKYCQKKTLYYFPSVIQICFSKSISCESAHLCKNLGVLYKRSTVYNGVQTAYTVCRLISWAGLEMLQSVCRQYHSGIQK